MSKSAVVTARIDPEILATIDEMAKGQDRTRAWIINKAVEDYAREWKAFRAWIQEAEDQINRGECHTQEEVEEMFRTGDFGRLSSR